MRTRINKGTRTPVTSHQFLSLLCSCALVLWCIGCGGPLKQINVSSYEFYRSPQVDKIDDNRIGILTTALSRMSSLGEYKVTISDIIEKAFQKEKPKINIISSRETINIINTSELTDI